ncbi:hypothetical protein [Pseudonocardia sp. DLS-67]
MVASAGWWLAVVSLGWAALAALALQKPWSAVACAYAAAIAGCAIGVLRGELWCVVVAACVLVAVPVVAIVLALLCLPIMIMLAGAFVRLRTAGSAAEHVPDPAAVPAGAACLVAAVAGALWIAAWVEIGSGWEELLVVTAFVAAPALVLAVAAVGMLLGTPGWAFVAAVALVVTGLVVLIARVSEGVVAGWVPMDLALLGSGAFAYVRLLRLARGAGLR